MYHFDRKPAFAYNKALISRYWSSDLRSFKGFFLPCMDSLATIGIIRYHVHLNKLLEAISLKSLHIKF